MGEEPDPCLAQAFHPHQALEHPWPCLSPVSPPGHTFPALDTPMPGGTPNPVASPLLAEGADRHTHPRGWGQGGLDWAAGQNHPTWNAPLSQPPGSCHKSARGSVGSRIQDPGAGMGPCRALPPLSLLLLLGLGLGLAGATTTAPHGSTAARDGWNGSTLSSPASLSYGDVVAAAVELLNARAVSPYVLRLRETLPRPGWPSDLQSRKELSFTLEETTCRTPGMTNGSCRSRWLGAVTLCQGSVFLEGQQPTVELSCEKAPATFGRVWKSKVKDFFGKIKQRFRGFFQCGRIWIRDKLNLKAPKP